MQFLGRALRLGQAREPSCHAKLLRNPAYCTSRSMYQQINIQIMIVKHTFKLYKLLVTKL